MPTTSHTYRHHERQRLNISASSWESLWDVAGRVLVVNLGFAVAASPLLLGLALVPRPWEYPAFFGLLALSVGPAATAGVAFLGAGDEATSVRHFVAAYRRTWRRALALWAPAVSGLVVLALDVVYLHTRAVGGFVIPLLAVLGTIVVSASVPGMVVAGSATWPGWRGAALTALYAAVRRPGFSAVNLAVLGVMVLSLASAPLIGLAAVPGFALIVWWRNATHVLETLRGAEARPRNTFV